MLDIFNPLFNVKEICKELVLLEAHLQSPEKRCGDCIRKHLLKAEAFAEEAIGLDKTGEHLHITKPIPTQIRSIQSMFEGGASDHEIGQAARKIRKSLTPYCFKTKKNKPAQKSATINKIEVQITQSMFPKQHWKNPAFKMLIRSLHQNKQKKGVPFRFDGKGVSARIKEQPEWIKQQAILKLQQGQTGRMISQTLYSKIKYTQDDWNKAVNADINGGKRHSLQTPSSSIGELVSNERKRKAAIQDVCKKGFHQMLSRASALEKKDPIRAGKMYLNLGEQAENVYFFARAAVLFEAMNQEQMEADAFERILKREPNHPLKFWLNNKVEMAERIKKLPKKQQTVENTKGNTALIGIASVVAGLLLGTL